MADIFISYSQSDRETARGLADFLKDCGYDVWWDYELVGGVKFRKQIKDQLTLAKAAIVIWTSNSVESEWVLDEAEEAKIARKLLPTRVPSLEFKNIPLGFRQLQTDLVTNPELILRSLDELGVKPSQAPVRRIGSARIGSNLSDEAINKAEAFAHWEFIKDSTDPANFNRFVELFPSSSFAQLARARLGTLAAPEWERLRDSKDVASLETFLQTFSNDPTAGEAAKRLAILRQSAEEAVSWERIKDTSDLAAVEAHLASFPEGAHATNAMSRRSALQREREAANRWSEIRDGTDLEVLDVFLTTFAETSAAQEAGARVAELRRQREERDWRDLQAVRHPTPILGFLKAHPDGNHAASAMKLLEDLPRTNEAEAWAEVRDCEQTLALKAFAVAFPKSRFAREARRRANLSTRPALHGPGMGRGYGSSGTPPKTGSSIGRYRLATIVIVLLAAFSIWMSVIAYNASLSFYASKEDVALGIALALSSMVVIMVLDRLWGRPLRGIDRDSPLRHAIWLCTIFGWMALLQELAVANHRLLQSNIDSTGKFTMFWPVLLVHVPAVLALWTGRLVGPRLYCGYLVVVTLVAGFLAIGEFSVQGWYARDYLISRNLLPYGSAAAAVASLVWLVPYLLDQARRNSPGGKVGKIDAHGT